MSKRHGATSIAEYRAEGFIAPGIINYLALLGWNPGTEQEVFTMRELIDAFDLHKIQKGGAVFDREKFLWFNREHIRRMSDAELTDAIMDILPETLRGSERATTVGLKPLLPLLRERAYTMSDIRSVVDGGEFSFAFCEPSYETALLKWKKDISVHDALPRLIQATEHIATLTEWPTEAEAKAVLWDYAESVGRGELLWPLRVSLSGRERSPDPFTLITILGREKSIARIQDACARIKS
jgi:glutamyl-tRNA synthetase